MVQATSQQASAIIGHRKLVSHSYYLVMQDFGHLGLEAVVRPEDTRRDIIQNIREGQYKHIVFIHHVDGLYVEDVTDELVSASEQEEAA
jgi:hypothetical protein